MPLYAYRCKKCNREFEVRQGFGDAPLNMCLNEDCEGGGEVVRLIQPAGIVFKGSGFYVTDNAGSRTSIPGPSKKSDESPAKNGDKSASPETSPSTTPVTAD